MSIIHVILLAQAASAAPPPVQAVALTPPTPAGLPPRPITSPGSWIGPDDYPMASWVAHVEGSVGFELTIDPSGSVQNCRIIQSSGSAELDQTTCDLLRKRARFEPARDAAGQAVHGSYRNRVRWIMPTPDPRDFALVDEDGKFMLTTVTYRFFVEPDGTTSDCVVEVEGVITKPKLPIGPCLTDEPYKPFLDGNGRPVRKRVIYTVSARVEDPPKH